MQIPKHPGLEPEDMTTPEYSKLERKLRKLTNFIQAVYLPWDKDVQEFRPPSDVIADLEKYMNRNLEIDKKNNKCDSDGFEQKQGGSGENEEKKVCRVI